MEKFKKGDSVIISKKSPYYDPKGRDPGNPINTIGVIENVTERARATDYKIEVKWKGSFTNSYSEKDLEKVDTSNILEKYAKYKSIPSIDKIMPKENRVDIKALADFDSFEEAGLDYESTAILLSSYETALRRLEEKNEFLEELYNQELQNLEKGKVDKIPEKGEDKMSVYTQSPAPTKLKSKSPKVKVMEGDESLYRTFHQVNTSSTLTSEEYSQMLKTVKERYSKPNKPTNIVVEGDEESYYPEGFLEDDEI